MTVINASPVADIAKPRPTPELRPDIGSIAWKTAQDFEAAFISQMLQFSGLADALTSNGGEDVEGFTQFYLEELAQDIVDNGGFGIAEKIYTHIKQKEENHGELGRL